MFHSIPLHTVGARGQMAQRPQTLGWRGCIVSHASPWERNGHGQNFRNHNMSTESWIEVVQGVATWYCSKKNIWTQTRNCPWERKKLITVGFRGAKRRKKTGPSNCQQRKGKPVDYRFRRNCRSHRRGKKQKTNSQNPGRELRFLRSKRVRRSHLWSSGLRK